MYLATKVDEEVFLCLDLIGEKCRNLKKLDLWVDVEGSVELNGAVAKVIGGLPVLEELVV